MTEGRTVAAAPAIAMPQRHRADWRTNPAALFVLLLLAGLAIDLLFGCAIRFRAMPAFLEADEREYYDLASSLLAGTLEPQSRRTLGYPAFLAGIRLLTADFRVLQVVSTTVYAFAAPLLFLVVRRVTGDLLIGFVAGCMLILWPSAIFYGTSLYSETAALPLFLLALLLVPPGSRLPTGGAAIELGAAVLAGLVLGITTHVRTMYQLFLPVLFVILLIEEARWRVAMGRFVMICLAWLAVILPWSMYLTQALGRPILVTSNGGETLGGGLNPELLKHDIRIDRFPGRNTWIGPGKWLPIGENGYLSPAEQALPPDRQDALMQQRAKAWALAHPGDAAYLELRKVAYMWGIYPLLINGRSQFLFGNLPTWGLLAIALLALGRMTPPQRALYARFWTLPLFVSGIALISWGSWRFRMPGDAGLIVLCAFAVVGLWRARGVRLASVSAR